MRISFPAPCHGLSFDLTSASRNAGDRDARQCPRLRQERPFAYFQSFHDPEGRIAQEHKLQMSSARVLGLPQTPTDYITALAPLVAEHRT